MAEELQLEAKRFTTAEALAKEAAALLYAPGRPSVVIIAPASSWYPIEEALKRRVDASGYRQIMITAGVTVLQLEEGEDVCTTEL